MEICRESLFYLTWSFVRIASNVTVAHLGKTSYKQAMLHTVTYYRSIIFYSGNISMLTTDAMCQYLSVKIGQNISTTK